MWERMSFFGCVFPAWDAPRTGNRSGRALRTGVGMHLAVPAVGGPSATGSSHLLAAGRLAAGGRPAQGARSQVGSSPRRGTEGKTDSLPNGDTAPGGGCHQRLCRIAPRPNLTSGVTWEQSPVPPAIRRAWQRQRPGHKVAGKAEIDQASARFLAAFGLRSSPTT